MMIDDGHTILGHDLDCQYVNINRSENISLARRILANDHLGRELL